MAEGHALDVIPCSVWVMLDITRVCGRSGEEWESLRFLEETVLGNESLHSRRFLGRGVTQPLCSVESCIPGDPPYLQGVAQEPSGKDQDVRVFSRLLTRHLLHNRRRPTANRVYMVQ
jgi:hypothetical protein